MIRISRHYTPILIDFISKDHPELLAHIMSSEEVNKDTAKKIRKYVEDEMIKNGFNENSEPNSYGMDLESIIDDINKNYLK